MDASGIQIHIWRQQDKPGAGSFLIDYAAFHCQVIEIPVLQIACFIHLGGEMEFDDVNTSDLMLVLNYAIGQLDKEWETDLW